MFYPFWISLFCVFSEIENSFVSMGEVDDWFSRLFRALCAFRFFSLKVTIYFFLFIWLKVVFFSFLSSNNSVISFKIFSACFAMVFFIHYCWFLTTAAAEQSFFSAIAVCGATFLNWKFGWSFFPLILCSSTLSVFCYCFASSFAVLWSTSLYCLVHCNNFPFSNYYCHFYFICFPLLSFFAVRDHC